MDNIDKRNRLDEEVFTYQVTKENKLLVFWKGKEVKLVKGQKAERIISKLSGLDTKEVQLVLARLTGNFKRGNER